MGFIVLLTLDVNNVISVPWWLYLLGIVFATAIPVRSV